MTSTTAAHPGSWHLQPHFYQRLGRPRTAVIATIASTYPGTLNNGMNQDTGPTSDDDDDDDDIDDGRVSLSPRLHAILLLRLTIHLKYAWSVITGSVIVVII